MKFFIDLIKRLSKLAKNNCYNREYNKNYASRLGEDKKKRIFNILLRKLEDLLRSEIIFF